MISAEYSFRTPVLTIYEFKYVPELLVSSPETTHKEYRSAIKFFGHFLGRLPLVEDLHKEQFIAYRAWRIQHGHGPKMEPVPIEQRTQESLRKPATGKNIKKLSTATANKDIRHLRSLEAFCGDEGMKILGRRQKLKPAREDTRSPQAYSIDDICRLLRGAAATPGIVPLRRFGRIGIPAGLFWWTFFSAAYDTGARKEVLFTRTWAHLNFEMTLMQLPGDAQKQRDEQWKDVHPDTLAGLALMREPKRDQIWHWPFHETTFYSHVRKILARCGLSRIPRKPCHGLRASHATYLFDKFGLDAARESCGHASSKTTERYYIDKGILTERRTSAALPRPGVFVAPPLAIATPRCSAQPVG